MRVDLTDEEWAIVGALLPPERGRWCRSAQDNRRFLNGMLYVLRVGCPWRHMHERYGKWNSVYVRFDALRARPVQAPETQRISRPFTTGVYWLWGMHTAEKIWRRAAAPPSARGTGSL